VLLCCYNNLATGGFFNETGGEILLLLKKDTTLLSIHLAIGRRAVMPDAPVTANDPASSDLMVSSRPMILG
jgi:hypothetical protein